MKILLNIIILAILAACNSKSGVKTIDQIDTDNLPIRTRQKLIDSTILKVDTLIINDSKFIQILKNKKFNSLISTNGDTIIKSENYYFEAKLLDINEDGYEDIRIFTFSNTPNECDNYLFDKDLNTFKEIENCDLDIQKIKGTKFYYSYNRMGCSDMNWESYLSKIENYRLIKYGYIYGQGCDFDIKKNPQIIEIFEVNNVEKDKKTLINTLPYLKHIPKFNDKWNFIEKYWIQNFKTFDH